MGQTSGRVVTRRYILQQIPYLASNEFSPLFNPIEDSTTGLFIVGYSMRCTCQNGNTWGKHAQYNTVSCEDTAEIWKAKKDGIKSYSLERKVQ